MAAHWTKPRVVISTDFPPLDGIPGGAPGGELNMKSDLDDIQSMVRFLTYSNEVIVEGLIASAGTLANIANKKHLLEIIDIYGQVEENLRLHDPSFPSAERLKQVTKEGLSGAYGGKVEDILGEGKDTEASSFIIDLVDDHNPLPIWFCFWGGPRELAQALWKVSATRTKEETEEFVSKIRVYMIDLQDGTGQWLKDNFPGLFIITSHAFLGMNNVSCFDSAWLDQHVTRGHGPLGETYPHCTWFLDRTGVSEGDSPSFLYLINGLRGLSDPSYPSYGGWGGRFNQVCENRWEDSPEGRESISRWEAHRNWDFAARMDWCVKKPHEVNHPPVVFLNGECTNTVTYATALPGQHIRLSSVGTFDPEDDELTLSWRCYTDDWAEEVEVANCNSKEAFIVTPHSGNLHVLLIVTDKGTPNLTSYKRLVVSVTANSHYDSIVG